MEPPFDPACLKHTVDQIPMRSTNAASKAPKVGNGLTQGLQEAILQYLAGSKTARGELNTKFLKPCNTNPLSNLSLPLKDSSCSSSQASLSDSQSSKPDLVDSQSSKPDSQVDKADTDLEDKPERLQVVKSLAKEKAVLPKGTPGKEASLTVAAQIADLKRKISAGKRKASEKDESEGQKGKQKVVPKKKGPSKKATQMKRRPAPEPVDKIKMDTRKRFTSRAYHRAMQSALKQGVSKGDAKEVARAAHREAAEQWDRQVQSA